MPDGSCVVVATNHTGTSRSLTLELKDGFAVENLWAANIADGAIALGPFQSAEVLLRR